MEIAALIIVLGSAALLAAASYGAVLGAGRFWHVPYPALWFAAGGAIVGAVISISVVIGWPAALFRTGGDAPVDTVMPYMQALRQHEPALHERIATLIARDRQDGRSEDEVRANAMSLALSYVADKSSQLPDGLVTELYSFTRDELVHLAATDEFEICADIALGRVRGDIELKLSRELNERHSTIVLRVIETPANPDAARMGAEQFAVLAAQAFAEASQATGVPAEQVDALLTGSGEPAKVCKLMKNFFDALLAQPVDVAASALRELAAGERVQR